MSYPLLSFKSPSPFLSPVLDGEARGPGDPREAEGGTARALPARRTAGVTEGGARAVLPAGRVGVSQRVAGSHGLPVGAALGSVDD